MHYIIIILFLIAFGATAWAATINVPDNVQTISETITYYGKPGDTVLVIGGIHPPVYFANDDVVLKADTGKGAVIDAGNQGPCG